jgi:hypothetical protein
VTDPPEELLRWRLDTTTNPARRRIAQAPTFSTDHGRRRLRPTGDERHAPMLVAVRTFTTPYDGKSVQIVAGRDRACADHPIVRANPHAFREIRR